MTRVQTGGGIEVSGPRDDADKEAFARLDGELFAVRAADSLRWLVAAGPHITMRVARIDGEVAGGYVLLPCGQFFGGRSVPTQAVSAVVVGPAFRRRGVAGALMRDCVTTVREQGSMLAPLHAATVRLYRRWGWGVCAQTLRQTVRTPALRGLAGEGVPRRNPDPAAVEALRSAHLARWDGPLDRPAWWLQVEWNIDDGGELRFEYGWYERGVLTGFVRYEAERQSRWILLRVQELIFTTPDALRGLLGFLGANESQSLEMIFLHSALPDVSPLLHLLPEPHRELEVSAHICWMQRIVDIEGAVRARGWPAHAAGRVELEVSDPVTGVERFVLEVEGGVGRVTPGGAGEVRCGIDVLSSWYSSTLRAEDAARLGMLEGDATAIKVMDGLIAGGVAWMPDFF